jgi:hypothetical protein
MRIARRSAFGQEPKRNVIGSKFYSRFGRRVNVQFLVNIAAGENKKWATGLFDRLVLRNYQNTSPDNLDCIRTSHLTITYSSPKSIGFLKKQQSQNVQRESVEKQNEPARRHWRA